MRNPLHRNGNEAIDEQIDAVIQKMNAEGVDSDKYPKFMGYLERLNKLKQQDKLPHVSRDTIFMVGGNLLIAFIVVIFEREHVWTSKVPIPFAKNGKH